MARIAPDGRRRHTHSPETTRNNPIDRVCNRRLDGARRPNPQVLALASAPERRSARNGEYRMVSQNARRDKVARVSLIAGSVALICAGTSAPVR